MNQNWCYIFPKQSLLRAYSLKHSLQTIKINHSVEMKICLCFNVQIVNNCSSCIYPGFQIKIPQYTATRYTHV